MVMDALEFAQLYDVVTNKSVDIKKIKGPIGGSNVRAHL
jgi:hypothetical protein